MAPSPSLGAPRVHQLHALLLGFPVALFATALANDLAYLATAEMQWSNFAAWAITGALAIGAPVLGWAVVSALGGRAGWAYPGLLAGMWVLGLVNAFQHSRDAWASVGATGLVLSILSTGLAIAAAWVAHSSRRQGGVR